jgi:endonuclease/exonuclease/phosphatase family metal-dependent hydrolase
MHKGALKVSVALGNGQRINIWNVHLQDGASGQVRSRQVAELIQWIIKAQDGQAADIVGGDFNFTPESEEFRMFVAAIGPDVHQLASDEAFPTWDGLKLTPEASQALDHIFVRLRQAGDEVSARPRKVFAAARPEDRLSDHMGMEALVTFRNAVEDHRPVLVGQRIENDRMGSPF